MAKYNSDWVERNVYYENVMVPGEEMPHFRQVERPVIVCLCGSTRFKDAFIKAQAEETLAGKVVLTVGLFGHSEGIDMTGPVKAALDVLHLRKVDLCDEILVLNVGGYIGESTRRELEYARKHGKTVRFLNPPDESEAK